MRVSCVVPVQLIKGGLEVERATATGRPAPGAAPAGRQMCGDDRWQKGEEPGLDQLVMMT
ncbi:hypothetical protein PVW51_20145 [Sulfitobacter sp. PR48]|nr:hypothetical protein [Sulfitobacter sp. PR48]